MRLTKYEPNDESMFPYKLKDEELSTELDSVHKLGKLEDILEKHNVSSLVDLDNRLVALEIIKKKEVNVQELFDFIKKYGEHNGLYMYNGNRPYEKRINEEEYDLLKEALK